MHWANWRGGSSKDDLTDDLQVFGATPEQLADWDEPDREEEHFSIWPENLETLTVFLALKTQWNKLAVFDGPPRYIGIRYEVIPMVMRNKRVKRDAWPDVFEGLQIIESAALAELNKPRD